MISVISMREAYLAQSKRENKRHQHDGGGIWWWRENLERARRVFQSAVVEQLAVLRKGWGRAAGRRMSSIATLPRIATTFSSVRSLRYEQGDPPAPAVDAVWGFPFELAPGD